MNNNNPFASFLLLVVAQACEASLSRPLFPPSDDTGPLCDLEDVMLAEYWPAGHEIIAGEIVVNDTDALYIAAHGGDSRVWDCFSDVDVEGELIAELDFLASEREFDLLHD